MAVKSDYMPSHHKNTLMFLEIVKVLLKETLIVLFLIVLDSKNLKSV